MEITDTRPLKCSQCSSVACRRRETDLGNIVTVSALCSSCGHESVLEFRRKPESPGSMESMIFTSRPYRSF